jgi:hypothetical protein
LPKISEENENEFIAAEEPKVLNEEDSESL